jgi:predicted PurR-regulated permease PerM
MEESYFKKIMTSLILFTLLVLSFLILKPILLSIIFGVILAFIFKPVYDWINNRIKSENLSAIIVCVFLLIAIVVPLLFLTPILINQFFKFYFSFQQVDLLSVFKEIFPKISSESFLNILDSVLQSSMKKVVNYLADILTINNIMDYFLKSFVTFFTFFFVLRDKNKIMDYIRSLLPFSKDIEKKLFKSSRDITYSMIYGQFIIGIIQGIIIGLGLFIFKVPNPIFLTLLAILAGIFPIVGTALIWIPVVIYLLVAGSIFSAFGIIIFGIISSSIDNFLRPIIVSKRTKINSSIIIIGMIGGLFLFGILGLILGPLILSYLLIFIELYRNKKTSGLLIKIE